MAPPDRLCKAFGTKAMSRYNDARGGSPILSDYCILWFCVNKFTVTLEPAYSYQACSPGLLRPV